MTIVLASGSPYRRRALEDLGIQFSVDPADIDESAQPNEPAGMLAERLANAKAAVVARRQPASLIIGSDQVGECRGELLAKPGTAPAARDQLARLSGQTARFHSAVAVHDGAYRACKVVVTEVVLRTLSAKEIERYVALDEPLDCAGSFKVEAHGISLFQRVTADDPTALVGLPMIALLRLLRERGISPI